MIELIDHVFDGLAAGKSQAQIAREQNVSPMTVSRTVSQMASIPRYRDRAGAISWRILDKINDQLDKLELADDLRVLDSMTKIQRLPTPPLSEDDVRRIALEVRDGIPSDGE